MFDRHNLYIDTSYRLLAKLLLCRTLDRKNRLASAIEKGHLCTAVFFGRKSILEFDQGFGEVFHVPTLHVGYTWVKWIPQLIILGL